MSKTNSSSPKPRREFIKSAAQTIVVGSSLVPLQQLVGAPAYLKNLPSKTVRLAAIGVKGIGWGNIQSFKKHPDADIIAFADVDANIGKQRQSDFEKAYGSKPFLVEDYRKLLENKDIDAIIINTPDHWHTLQCVHALEAGKDIYIEKPLANSIDECLRIERAQKRWNRVVQVGQQQRSGKHFQDAMAWLTEGELGKIRQVRCWIFNANKGSVPKLADEPVPVGVNYDAWLGPAPLVPFNKNRFHFTFRWYWEYAGGLMTDWGVHLLDVALWGMKNPEPIKISALGGKFAFPEDAMETPDTLTALYQFPDFQLSWEHTIGIGRGPFDREHGIAFYGENGTLIVDRKGWEVLPELKKNEKGLRVYRMPVYPFQAAYSDDRAEHTRNFLNAIKDGSPLACPIETGSKVAILAHLGNVAYRSGEVLGWDAAKKQIKGSATAQKLVSNAYRKPYVLPNY